MVSEAGHEVGQQSRDLHLGDTEHFADLCLGCPLEEPHLEHDLFASGELSQ